MNQDRFNAAQAADYCSVTVEEIKTQTKLKKIRHLKPSPRKTLYTKQDLDMWIASWQRVEAH